MSSLYEFARQRLLSLVSTIIVVAIGITVVATHKQWMPLLRQMASGDSAAADSHGSEDGHAAHGELESIQLSDVARKNIGLKTGVIQPASYARTVKIPAMVVERPGRSQVNVTAPMTGIVTRVYPIEGQTTRPNDPLFDLRLTHEDLVTAQRDFLKSAQEFDVVEREIARLESVAEGVIAGRRVLEHKYERDKIQAAMHAQRQGLLLHGLSAAQIELIFESRRLVQSLTVVTPPFPKDDDHIEESHLFHVQRIHVKPGEQVTAGTALATLADHCLLYVEGKAFEDDIRRLTRVIARNQSLAVTPLAAKNSTPERLQLKVLYIADHVEQDSRALGFFMRLPNQLVRGGREQEDRFAAWRYRPGQRMEIRIPLGPSWDDQIVLPKEAVVQDGVESYVFEQNGDHFDRVPVHIVFQDTDVVVVENDGSMIGSTLAMSGAYEMQLELKKQAGGGVDPHAGHTH